MFSPTIPLGYDAQIALAQLPIGTKLIFSENLDAWVGTDEQMWGDRYWVTTASGIRMFDGHNRPVYVTPFRDVRTDFPYTVVESAEGEVFYARGSVQTESS